MPFYNDLRPRSDFEDRDFEQVIPDMPHHEKLRCIEGLIALRALLGQHVSPRKTEGNLLVASWNIANLGDRGRHGEALYYIAETLAAFDLIAVQEVTSNRADLDRIMRILGPNWGYIYSDPARGPGANDESSAYLYNADRVRPSGLTGELTVWTQEMEGALDGGLDPETRSLTRFATQRPPYITGFTTRWKSFSLINLHLQPGKTRADAALRGKELELVIAALKANEDQRWAENTVLLGDMNFHVSIDDANIAALHAEGFWESEGLVGQTTNVPAPGKAGHVYDRMFFSVGDYFRIAREALPDGTTRERGGVVPLYDAVMTLDGWQAYHQEVIDKRETAAQRAEMRTDLAAAQEYFRAHWRWRQVSDHLPIWVELQTDDTTAFLNRNKGDLSAEGPVG